MTTTPIDIYLEIGKKRVFAGAVAWHVLDHLWELEDRMT